MCYLGRYFPIKDSGREIAYELNDNEVPLDEDSCSWNRFSYGRIFEVKISDFEEEYEDIEVAKNNEKELLLIKTLDNVESYNCDTCEFEFVDNYLSFFYDEEQQVTVSYMMIMSIVGISDGSEITGSVSVTYCPDCDKVIKHYIIFNYPKDLDKDMIINKVKE